MGAPKEALKNVDLGLKIAGGKGAVSRKTPLEVRKYADLMRLGEKKAGDTAYASRAAAKVDSAALQAGEAKVGNKEKLAALQRLKKFAQ